MFSSSSTLQAAVDNWRSTLSKSPNAILPGAWQDPNMCSECHGSGKLTILGGDWGKTPDSEVKCWACKGSGRKILS